MVGLKNEVINRAIERIVKDKLNIELKSTPEFIGVFENFYDDSIFNDISTHYVNLAYEYEVGEIDNLSIEQYNEYK